MYPKRQAKSDRERFLDAFKKKVGSEPAQYLQRKLASGADEAELQKLYDMLAVEIAMKAHCTAIRYADVFAEQKKKDTAEYHRQRAGSQKIPTCSKCGAQMVLRTGVTGARKGQKYWGCPNYPVCRYTRNLEA